VTRRVNLGLELITNKPVTLRLGTFFETWIATPSGTVRRSLGRDEYHLGLGIAEGRRLAATGRTHICQIDLEAAELGPNQARAAILAAAKVGAAVPIICGIRTNLFLDLPALTNGVRARLLRGGEPPLETPLGHPLLLAAEAAPGRYILDVSGLLFASSTNAPG
jgi:hypothetical protein